jgi:hypothetical protein
VGIVSRSQGGGSGGGILLFDSTLGASAASIDTGAGGIAASANLMLVTIIARTDEAAVSSVIDVVVNNDSSAIYDLVQTRTTNATVTGGNAPGLTRWQILAAGNSNDAGVFAQYHFAFGNYRSTTAHKFASGGGGLAALTAANNLDQWMALRYRSTTAISRLAVSRAGGNLLADSRLLIVGI